jgi:hypothetical protein
MDVTVQNQELQSGKFARQREEEARLANSNRALIDPVETSRPTKLASEFFNDLMQTRRSDKIL